MGCWPATWSAATGWGRSLLVSRSGMDSAGAAELVADLTQAGAQVEVIACDVADPDAATALITDVRPAVIGYRRWCTPPVVLDDAVIGSLTPAQRIDTVLRAQGRRRLASARADPRADR